MDFEQTIDDEEYKFKASRKKFDRRLARLVLRSDIALVAFFIDIPVSEKAAHEAAFHLLESTAKAFLPTVILKPVDIGKAQLLLDKGVSSPGLSVATKRSRIHSPGAYVEFGSTSAGDYKDIAVVREVRKAAQSKLQGQSGDFIFSLPSTTKIATDARAISPRGFAYLQESLSDGSPFRITPQELSQFAEIDELQSKIRPFRWGDIGASGTLGFRDKDILEVISEEWGHSTTFNSQNIEKTLKQIWIPFLKSPD
eukprot:gene978-987_t